MGITTLAPQNYELLGQLANWGMHNLESISPFGLTGPILDQIKEESFFQAPISPNMATDAFMLSFAASSTSPFTDVARHELMSGLMEIAGDKHIFEHARTLPAYFDREPQFRVEFNAVASLTESSRFFIKTTSELADVSEVPLEELNARYGEADANRFWEEISAAVQRGEFPEGLPLGMRIRNRRHA